MQAYGVKPEFVDMIERDEKRLTLRRQRVSGAPHAKVGDVIGIWTNWRTPQVRKIAVGLVVIRATLLIEEKGIAAVTQRRVLNAAQEDVAGVEVALDCARHDGRPFAPDQFARFDGFANWRALWAWHDAHRAASERGDAQLTRELIVWRRLTGEAAIAAEAAGRIDAEAAA